MGRHTALVYVPASRREGRRSMWSNSLSGSISLRVYVCAWFASKERRTSAIMRATTTAFSSASYSTAARSKIIRKYPHIQAHGMRLNVPTRRRPCTTLPYTTSLLLLRWTNLRYKSLVPLRWCLRSFSYFRGDTGKSGTSGR